MGRSHVRGKFKQSLLVVCLFLFLLVVLGGGLHLNPLGALLAASTGTPLIIYGFNGWCRQSVAQASVSQLNHGGKLSTLHTSTFESRDTCARDPPGGVTR